MKDYKKQIDDLVLFLKENGVHLPDNILVPWQGLLESAYADGVNEGKDKAYSEIAQFCNRQMNQLSVIAVKHEIRTWPDL